MLKILLVEDDKTIVANLTEYLNGAGYIVRSVSGQSAAMAVLAEEKADLVLLDVSLAEGNGFSACRAIKVEFDLPVIFLTASGDEYSTVTGFDLGADDYIPKPFRPRELLSRIKNVLRLTGSTGKTVKLGDVVIPNGAVTMEGTGNHYLPFEFPAVPDFEMLRALEEAAEKLGYPYNIGVTITKDSFYTEAEPETKPVYHELKEKWDSYLKGGATNTSMECSVLFLIGASLGIRTSSVMISATNFGDYSNDADDYPSGWEERAIEVGIEAMKILIRKDQEA